MALDEAAKRSAHRVAGSSASLALAPKEGLLKALAAASDKETALQRSPLSRLLSEPPPGPTVSPPKSSLMRAIEEAEAASRKQRDAASKAFEVFKPRAPLRATPVPLIRPLEDLRIDVADLERSRNEAEARGREEARAQHQALLDALLQIAGVQQAQLEQARRMQRQAEDRARCTQAESEAERERHATVEAKRDKRERVLIAAAVASPIVSAIAIVVSIAAA